MSTRGFSRMEDEWAKLLVKHGFIIPEMQGAYKKSYDPVKDIFHPLEGDYDPAHALQEFAEEITTASPMSPTPTEYIPTSYPDPLKRYHLVYEAFNMSIEETYFWIIDHIRYDQGFTRAHKIRDIFTATENSAFFGNSQARLGIQQDRVQQYLATIGKMIKDLFQLVRELRILDEKLEPRREWKNTKAADITLKGEFVDLVENRGGQTNAASVYGLAQQLGYASLPDLFFNTHVYSTQDVERVVDRLEFNKNLKAVLKRKLYQFVTWKLKTDKELEQRRRFTLKYLRQHWDVIEMYMTWIKPYLRHIARLQMNEDRLDEPDLIGAFEQSFIETEVLFAKPQPKKNVFDVMILTINFRTRPQMSYNQEYQHRGPAHSGRADIFLRGYTWSDDVIRRYIKYRREEDLYMLGVVDKSVQNAMEALGDELEHYLAEAGEPKYAEKLAAEQRARERLEREAARMANPFKGLLEPFGEVFKGFAEVFSFVSASTPPKAVKGASFPKGKASPNLKAGLYQTVKNYKKAHGMLSWG
ncbi:hypothetical protein D6789_04125 [Candidatus Woesearchaeota archaeon]|nr:MAG: hypothetical protein D6789_04125 [Candidatus Woesearchaeota archaeon]